MAQSEVDDLMDRDPLGLTANDIDSIIAYHRKARANAVPGKKAKREAGPKVDISEVMGNLLKAEVPMQPTIRRR